MIATALTVLLTGAGALAVMAGLLIVNADRDENSLRVGVALAIAGIVALLMVAAP